MPKVILFLCVCTLVLAITAGVSHAQTAVWVDQNVYWNDPTNIGGTATDAKITVTDWEQVCTDNYTTAWNSNNPRPTTSLLQQRADVNASAYLQSIWLTRAGDPQNKSSSFVPPTATNIPMQINGMDFLCAIILSNAQGYPNPNVANSIAHQVTFGNYPGDGIPVPDDPSPQYKVNQASRYESNSKITSVVVAQGGGTISNSPVNQIITYKRDDTSRYWLANTLPFTYVLPVSTIPLVPGQKYTFKVDVSYITIQTYHAFGQAGTSRCTLTSTGNGGNVGYNQFGQCNPNTVSVSFAFTVKGTWKLSGTSMVNKPTLSAGQQATFKHTVTNLGPQNADYTWQIESSTNGGAYTGAGLPSGVVTNSPLNANNPNVKTSNYKFPNGAPATSTYCQRIHYTNATGPSTAAGNSVPACVTPSNAPPPVGACPGDPTMNASQLVQVSLPNTTPASQSPPAGKPKNGASYTVYTPAGAPNGTQVTALQDTSGGSLTPVPTSAPLSWMTAQSYQSATLNYAPINAKYPYDSNQLTVFYNSFYTSTKYTYNAAKKTWVAGNPSGLQAMSPQPSVAAYRTQACYHPHVTVDDPTVTARYDDDEDPTQVITSGLTNVHFDPQPGVPANGLRNPVSANLSYVLAYLSSNPAHPVTCPVTPTSSPVPTASALGTITPLSLQGVCNVSAPPLDIGDKVCVTYNIVPQVTDVDASGNIVPGTDSGIATGQACTAPIKNNPYVHFMGRDVSAGGSFATGNNACLGSSLTPSGISAFVKGSGPLTRGSGSQFGAMALGTISQFDSAILRTNPPSNPPPNAPSGLTFSNSGNPKGNLGLASHCLPDYYSKLPGGAVNTPVDPTTSGNYSYNGPVSLGGLTIADGVKTAVYVKGDVTITGNIVFANSTGWASVDHIPSFYLVASGNIYIAPGVSQLDGVYIAQPNAAGANGVINTCAFNGGLFDPNSAYSSCNNQLQVNGAFIAQQVLFARTFASLRNSLGGEFPINASSPALCNLNTSKGQRTNPSYDCAAEVFNFSPETYLSQPGMNPSGGPAVGKYDYIISLSPVL